MRERTTALVTGANKGIGYEIAKGLGALGWSVGVGARDDQRREAAVERLRTAGVDAFGVPLDVTDDASATAAARLIEEQAGRLDVLVNNAAITGGMPQHPTGVDPATIRTVVETNVIGVIRVTNAMLPLLRRSPAGRIGNVSSGLGTVALLSDPGSPLWQHANLLGYNSSKAALNAITLIYAGTLRGAGIRVNALSPGFCATDLNNHTGPLSADEGGAHIARQVTRPGDGPTGVFLSENGGTHPW